MREATRLRQYTTSISRARFFLLILLRACAASLRASAHRLGITRARSSCPTATLAKARRDADFTSLFLCVVRNLAREMLLDYLGGRMPRAVVGVNVGTRLDTLLCGVCIAHSPRHLGCAWSTQSMCAIRRGQDCVLREGGAAWN